MIYVDDLKKCQPRDDAGGRWRWQHYCHLFSDSFRSDGGAELHAAAARLGLKRDYFADLPGFPHYPITATKRRLAVQHGARQISTPAMVELTDIAGGTGARKLQR